MSTSSEHHINGARNAISMSGDESHGMIAGLTTLINSDLEQLGKSELVF